MKILRWILGLICVGLVLFEMLPPAQMAGYKLGYLPATTPDEQRMIPLMDATPWWVLIAWGVVILIFVAAAVQLFRGRRAFPAYAAGFVLNTGFWFMMSQQPVYQQTFNPGELRSDYFVMGVIAAIGAAIFLFERTRRA